MDLGSSEARYIVYRPTDFKDLGDFYLLKFSNLNWRTSIFVNVGAVGIRAGISILVNVGVLFLHK